MKPMMPMTVVGKSEYIYQKVKANQGLRTKSKGWASAPINLTFTPCNNTTHPDLYPNLSKVVTIDPPKP